MAYWMAYRKQLKIHATSHRCQSSKHPSRESRSTSWSRHRPEPPPLIDPEGPRKMGISIRQPHDGETQERWVGRLSTNHYCRSREAGSRDAGPDHDGTGPLNSESSGSHQAPDTDLSGGCHTGPHRDEAWLEELRNMPSSGSTHWSSMSSRKLGTCRSTSYSLGTSPKFYAPSGLKRLKLPHALNSVFMP